MSVFDPRVNPLVTTTETKETTTPDYYTDYLKNLSAAGTTELARPADTLVAPLTQLQTQGYAGVSDAAGAYKPGLTTAGETAAKAAGIGAEDISRFMDPYQQNVVNEMERLAQQNIQRNVMPSLIGGAVGMGDLGSRRYAGALGQSMGDIQKTLTGQQYGALSSGYKNALEAAIKEAELQNMVSQTQAKQAEMEQALGLTGAKAMTTAGGELQKFEQAKLDAPLSRAIEVGKIMQGQKVPETTTGTRTAPGTKDQLGTSTLGNVQTLGAIVKGVMSGSAGSTLKALFTKYFSGAKLTPAEQKSINDFGSYVENQENPGDIEDLLEGYEPWLESDINDPGTVSDNFFDYDNYYRPEEPDYVYED